MERRVELDFLRVIAMFGIVGLHVIGGIQAKSLGTKNEIIVVMFLSVLYCSVNIFALLSGYLKVKSKVTCTSIIDIWGITLFWCCLIVIFLLIKNRGNIGFSTLINYMFPVVNGRLWYVTCYSFCFFLMPYMNDFLNKAEEEKLKALLMALFILMSVIPTYGFRDFFHVVNSGYSAAWLMFLYMLGGYLRLYGSKGKFTSAKLILILVINCSLMMLSTYFIKSVLGKIGIDNLNDKIYVMYYYSSPHTVLNAIIIFKIFAEKISVQNIMITKIVKWMSSVSFGVYVIHAHPYFLDNLFLYKYFGFLLENRCIGCVLGIISSMVIIYIICGVLEEVRKKAFQMFKLKGIENIIGETMDKILLWKNE